MESFVAGRRIIGVAVRHTAEAIIAEALTDHILWARRGIVRIAPASVRSAGARVTLTNAGEIVGAGIRIGIIAARREVQADAIVASTVAELTSRTGCRIVFITAGGFVYTGAVISLALADLSRQAVITIGIAGLRFIFAEAPVAATGTALSVRAPFGIARDTIVAVRVRVAVSVGVAVSVAVAVGVPVGVGITIRVGIAVGIGVAVNVSVSVTVATVVARDDRHEPETSEDHTKPYKHFRTHHHLGVRNS